MSESESTPEAIDDDQLPEDLRPDDNPLAEGLAPGETVDGLLTDGKQPDEPADADGTEAGDQAGDDGES